MFAEFAQMRQEQAPASIAMNANQARAYLRKKLNDAEETAAARRFENEPIPAPSRPIQVGDWVEIPGVRTPAEVVSVGKDGALQLKAGVLKMKAKSSEVRLVEDHEKKNKKPVVSIAQRAAQQLRTVAAASELDIRGMETLDAEGIVAGFIDSAVMGRLETVTIIHGKGTGALRKAVHVMLRRNPSVKDFRLGVYGEGEGGVTVVTLK